MTSSRSREEAVLHGSGRVLAHYSCLSRNFNDTGRLLVTTPAMQMLQQLRQLQAPWLCRLRRQGAAASPPQYHSPRAANAGSTRSLLKCCSPAASACNLSSWRL